MPTYEIHRTGDDDVIAHAFTEEAAQELVFLSSFGLAYRAVPDPLYWTIPYPFGNDRPFGMSANDSVGTVRARQRKAAEIKKLREQLVPLILAEVDQAGITYLQVDLTQYVTDARTRDADNLFPLLKVTADAVCSSKGESAHLVPDDSPEFCLKLMPQIVLDRSRPPGYEFTITALQWHHE